MKLASRLTAYKRRSRLFPEDDGTDFPFYPGSPSSLSPSKWGIILASLVATTVMMDRLYPTDTLGLYMWWLLPTILPLGILAMVTSEHWKKLFKPVGRREFRLMFLTACYSLGVSGLCSIVIKLLSKLNEQPVEYTDHPIETTVTAPEASNWLPVEIALKWFLYLMSEELLVILPFLALFAVLIKFGVSRIWAVNGALVVSSIIFGLLHMDVYAGNLAQVLVVIPLSRIVMTYAFIKTKNLWVTTGAHIMYDIWLLTTMVLGIPQLF